MATRKNTLKKILSVCCATAIGMTVLLPDATAQQVEPGEFPFFRSFLDGKTDYIKFPTGHGGRTNATNADCLSEYGLVLTYGTSQVGAFFLPQHTFDTNDGFLIEFEYIMQGTDHSMTDGITMFLVDAKPEYIGDNLMFGAAGAGFGYTHNMGYLTANRISGIKGGYLAVALDQGPFKVNRMLERDYGDEMRNGIPYDDTFYSTGSLAKKYDTRSNITIRGAAGNALRTIVVNGRNFNMPEGRWGYPVLATRHTGWDPDTNLNDPQNLRNDAGFKLDTGSGLYVKDIQGQIPNAFNIAGGGDFTGPEDPRYRKAIIALEPNPNTSEGGFKITVTIQHGTEKTTVIQNFTYPLTLKYIENGFAANWDSNTGYAQIARTPPIEQYTVTRPEKLVIGFTASTGGITPYTNIIRNLRITPIYAANTANDDIRDHRRGPVTIRPLDNDLGYKTEGSSYIGDKDFLNPATFRFWLDEYTGVGEGDYEISVPGKGKWVYDPQTREVLFFPVKGFTGQVEIMYDIKGMYAPFNEEKYRSSLATISVTIENNQPTP